MTASDDNGSITYQLGLRSVTEGLVRHSRLGIGVGWEPTGGARIMRLVGCILKIWEGYILGGVSVEGGLLCRL